MHLTCNTEKRMFPLFPACRVVADAEVLLLSVINSLLSDVENFSLETGKTLINFFFFLVTPKT